MSIKTVEAAPPGPHPEGSGAILEPTRPGRLVLAGIVTIVFGHMGAVAGALLVGTAGLILCYVAGVWFLVLAVVSWRRSRPVV